MSRRAGRDAAPLLAVLLAAAGSVTACDDPQASRQRLPEPPVLPRPEGKAIRCALGRFADGIVRPARVLAAPADGGARWLHA